MIKTDRVCILFIYVVGQSEREEFHGRGVPVWKDYKPTDKSDHSRTQEGTQGIQEM